MSAEYNDASEVLYQVRLITHNISAQHHRSTPPRQSCAFAPLPLVRGGVGGVFIMANLTDII
ncbi:hypothetical protein [Nostoc sp. CHAB 5715]|uniref:hypothetical protein n=1 Tax=Nostoc sp. CHAB 5715 TaxID=2780400 RepID=UPI001E48F9DF|nr:hypothetical protein [Nostoc sp. CHAB 5715]MCC5620991.1 hypothetical protein [Nostoc sp. CHAB 5715]